MIATGQDMNDPDILHTLLIDLKKNAMWSDGQDMASQHFITFDLSNLFIRYYPSPTSNSSITNY